MIRYIYISVLLCWAALAVRAQEPLPTTPRRVSGGVVESDTTAVVGIPVAHPQSPIFRDSVPISRVAAISLAVPGFAQLYNRDYWKIPVLYGAVGGFTYLTVDANKKFQRYKRQYDFLMSDYYAMENVSERNDFLTGQIAPVRTQMVKYNTQRTVYFAGAAATYLYFLADGVLNYPNQTTKVKRATTLALMFPGAGQLYNKSYWKIPVVAGAFVTMGYLIDWNNRQYQRARRAYNLYPNDEFGGRKDPTALKSARDGARRNRDLCIILTGAAYLLSVVEAHVDAYMKDFDVSDDLSMRVEPTLLDLGDTYISGAGSYACSGVGMALRINF